MHLYISSQTLKPWNVNTALLSISEIARKEEFIYDYNHGINDYNSVDYILSVITKHIAFFSLWSVHQSRSYVMI